MKISFRKLLLSASLIVFLAATLTSCHGKEGCPNKITQTGVINLGDNT